MKAKKIKHVSRPIRKGFVRITNIRATTKELQGLKREGDETVFNYFRKVLIDGLLSLCHIHSIF